MTNAANRARKLTSLLKKIPAAAPALPTPEATAIEVLVHSFLLWESTSDKAQAAYGKLTDAFVDYNDLRVTLPHEFVEVIGQRYPRGQDRACRVRATLRDVYLREHTMDLDRLTGMGKREVRKYIETLDGVVPFVAARVMILCFGVHAMPVDEQLSTHLVAAGVAEEGAGLPELSSWLSRQVKASDGPAACGALQAWCDKQGQSARRPSTKSRTASSKKSKKKTSARTRGRSAARASK